MLFLLWGLCLSSLLIFFAVIAQRERPNRWLLLAALINLFLAFVGFFLI